MTPNEADYETAREHVSEAIAIVDNNPNVAKDVYDMIRLEMQYLQRHFRKELAL